MFADNEDVHKSSQEVKVQPDPTSATAELAALERLEKSQWTDNGENPCCNFKLSQLLFILFIPHDELNIRLDLTTGYRFGCP